MVMNTNVTKESSTDKLVLHKLNSSMCLSFSFLSFPLLEYILYYCPLYIILSVHFSSQYFS